MKDITIYAKWTVLQIVAHETYAEVVSCMGDIDNLVILGKGKNSIFCLGGYRQLRVLRNCDGAGGGDFLHLSAGGQGDPGQPVPPGGKARSEGKLGPEAVLSAGRGG